MEKQVDVKSQTSSPFALTWQSIQQYGQLKQQQYLSLDRVTVKQSSVLKKQLACMSLCVF